MLVNKILVLHSTSQVITVKGQKSEKDACLMEKKSKKLYLSNMSHFH